MKAAIIFMVGLALAGSAFAHGVGYRDAGLKAVALEFLYSTGEKMSYREAKVFSPKDNKFAIQSGRTDEEGRFAFVPDYVGEWRVIVRDEEGHQCEAKINITQEFLDGTEKQEAMNTAIPQGTDLVIRALLGVSIIFNIAMIVKRRKA